MTSYSYFYDNSDDNSCSNWTITGTTSQATLHGLNSNTKYYWQVKATNETGDTFADGSLSACWTFTTGDNIFIPGEMVYVPSGEFQMGCHPDHNGGYSCYNDELPLHTVYLDAYYIDKTEVTNAQYAQCVAAGACWFHYVGMFTKRKAFKIRKGVHIHQSQVKLMVEQKENDLSNNHRSIHYTLLDTRLFLQKTPDNGILYVNEMLCLSLNKDNGV